MNKKTLPILPQILLVILFVYSFLVSIGLMGAAFKGFGKGFAEQLISSTSNPFVGLFIGLFATSLVQSSSTTTSIVVGMVGSGVMTVGNAIPIIMGANIGTTVTSMLVSIGHIRRREEFRRAIKGASVHDFFNIICVAILFPLQVTTGFLEKIASKTALIFADFGGIKFTSPVKHATKPAIHLIQDLLFRLNTPAHTTNILLLIISIVILFFSLFFIVRLMKSLVAARAEIVLNKVLGRHGLLAILAGLFFTALVQSSSITTSLMVPLVASGILTVETIFPITIGANIGTTLTAILASFSTGNISAITVAFVHFLFNLIGACFIFPIKPIRKIPLFLAHKLGDLAFTKRRYVIVYVLTLFFIIPGMLIALSKIIK